MVEEGGVICDGDGLLDKSRGCDDELDGRSVIVVSRRRVRLGLRLRPLLIFGRDRWRVNMLIDCSDEKICSTYFYAVPVKIEKNQPNLITQPKFGEIFQVGKIRGQNFGEIWLSD